MSESNLLLDAAAIDRAVARMAHEISERNSQPSSVVIVGIQRGGVYLAERLAERLKGLWGLEVPVGQIDVAMHRDDLHERVPPAVHPTTIPEDVTGKSVVLVDDVIFHGRTARAAMDALNDLGRPKSIQLAVLIDRGHRELPIRADFVGKNIPTSLQERVNVLLKEEGGVDAVYLEKA